MRIGLNSAQDFMALLVRRKWWVIAPFVGLSCVFAVLTYFLPRTYISETLILVQPRDVPQDFVRNLIAGTPEERLRSIEQTLLSRTNLIQILREFGSKLPEFDGMNLDQQVTKLRGQIDIAFELEKSGNGQAVLTYFRILYQNQNPELAQKIASKLTTLFIDQDNKTREDQVFGTTEFLSAELDKVSQQLTQSAEQLKRFKSSRQFELPDQRDANLRTLDRLANDRKTNAEALDRYATIRLNLETQLSQTPASVPKPLTLELSTVRNPQLEELRKKQADYDEYRKAQSEYDDLASKYTEKHPEVQAAKARLERLKQRAPTEPPSITINDDKDGSAANGIAARKTTEPNPLYQKLIAQMQEVKTEFEIREREKTWIDAEITKYSGRVENAPKAEQDIAEVVRVNDDLKKQYDDLKNKLSQARLSESLESKQRGAQFKIADPANYPLVPAKPNKLNVYLASVFISLLAALAFAVAIDVSRQKIWTQSQIETFWGVPVLVDIPEIVTDTDTIALRKKRVVYAFSSAAVTAVYGVCLYIVYLKHAPILQQLDPLIQKLVYK